MELAYTVVYEMGMTTRNKKSRETSENIESWGLLRRGITTKWIVQFSKKQETTWRHDMRSKDTRTC